MPTETVKYPWWPYALFVRREAALGQQAEHRGGVTLVGYELLRFGLKQAWACLFGGAMVALLIATWAWYPRGAALARYDFLVVASVMIQLLLIACRMETYDEAKVILMFHVVGTIMEIFKTHMGSWVYPEASLLRIGSVPLFTGFMYASIGSYIARAWRLFDFHFTHHPPLWATLVLSVAIYVNFFTHHYMADVRWLIFAIIALCFGRTWVHFRIWRQHRRMPLLVGFLLVALFIWFAENIGTITNAWLYPNQKHGWSMVSLAKLGSWYMLMIISYVMVSLINPPKGAARLLT